MLDNATHQPLRQTLAAMSLQDEHVGKQCESRFVGDDTRKANLRSTVIDAKAERILDRALDDRSCPATNSSALPGTYESHPGSGGVHRSTSRIRQRSAASAFTLLPSMKPAHRQYRYPRVGRRLENAVTRTGDRSA
ncbi:hypothetical protein G6P99_48145 [Bradyrhizobium sp. 6(2017)]|nr:MULTISPECIES: hypothetical protein [unclassified Bradyrhizobium]